MKRFLVIMVVLSVFSVRSQTDALFDEANEAYNAGDYQTAIALYGQILEEDLHSAELYFNLGNAHYKLNEIGPSIYYYEKALLLDPNDSEIKNNLAYAQNMRLDAIENMPKTTLNKVYDDVLGVFSFDQWAKLAVILSMAFVATYLFYYFSRSALKKRIAFISSMVILFWGIVCVTLSYLGYQQYKNDNPAIVFAEEVKITSEPNSRGQVVFTLHEGTKVNVLDEFEGWSKIKIADGQTGWLPAEHIKALKDF
jgi:tetratricopeptide (TPR) repeat protein